MIALAEESAQYCMRGRISNAASPRRVIALVMVFNRIGEYDNFIMQN